MRLAVLVAGALAQALAVVGVATAALVRSDYLALGLAGVAMGVSAGTAVYVYVNVTRVRKRNERVARVEQGAAKIEQRLSGK